MRCASAALGHVEHVWVHVLGRELPLAVGVHELDPAQPVAREAEPLRQHATPAPERQARHADAALGAARDDAAVLGELVVELACRGKAPARLGEGPTEVLRRGSTSPQVWPAPAVARPVAGSYSRAFKSRTSMMTPSREQSVGG